MANIPIFIPHAGCKNDCAFCNQKSITGKIVPPTVLEARAIIEESLKTLEGDGHRIDFFGGSFTGIGNALMEEYLSLAEEYVDKKKIKGIRLSTRPDYITEEILDILGKYTVTNIELGAQSLDEEVLSLSKRGHSRADVEKAAELIVKRSITLGLQMMIGLPGDTYEKSLETAKSFVALGAKETRIYPTVVLKGTLLEKMLRDGSYVPMGFEEAIDTAADCYSIFFENGVKVLRIGLQNTEELKENAIGGFYHEALGEKVYSRVIRRSAQREMCGEIRYNKRFLSKVSGQKKENLPYYKNYTLTEDNSLHGVCINEKYVLTI